MGLDIYLHRYEDLALHEKLEEQYNKQSEDNWNDWGRSYEQLTDEEKDITRKKNDELKISLGIIDNDSIEIPSTKYPDHYFKIGYWRSSYNGGGINRILSNLGLPDLYDIMDRKEDENYIWQPNWEECLQRVDEVIDQLRSKPNIRCFEISLNELSDPTKNKTISEEKAIELFTDQSKKFRKDDDGYSNIDGHFYPQGLKVFGLLPGLRKQLFGDGFLPVTYVIFEGENEWYINALEIVKETIEFVLSKEDKDKYYLHWSS